MNKLANTKEPAIARFRSLSCSGQSRLKKRKLLGSFYTPRELANWVAAEMLAKVANTKEQISNVFDPACGNGTLLEAVRCSSVDPIRLAGIDIDPEAVSECRTRLGRGADIQVGDALDPELTWDGTSPDAVIMNPPWGGELARNRHFYETNGYRLASGQFDISDLFVERALLAAKEGAIIALILPDAIFQPDHQPLREMLLGHTIHLIARLGEGIFEGVCRSTVVIVLRKRPPHENHLIECLQIPASQRRLLKRGAVSFDALKPRYTHRVPQVRFTKNANFVFNIAQYEQDQDIFEKFSRFPMFNWKDRIYLGRGVEIGKRGITVCCEDCGTHRAAPSSQVVCKCPTCGKAIPASSARYAIIAKRSDGPDWVPLIVGEDVDRYAVDSSRYILLGVHGIRYKPMRHFAEKKLLIRKTGVGLRAAVDNSGSATIQTVFYAVTRCEEENWILDYLQGVLNSRPVLAWYLRWTGESQWRSHPYVTPKVLKKLPIPDPATDFRLGNLAQKIALEAARAREGVAESDHMVDDLVCRLYELDAADRSWISKVLADTDDNLNYFHKMRVSAANTIANGTLQSRVR